MSLWQKLSAVFQRQKHDDDLADELQAHVRMATEDLIAEGVAPEEARRRALVKLGGVDQAKELHREARGWPWLETLAQDLRYAGRSLGRDAGFTLFATLIIGLGAGASTAVFSIVNTVLVKPLPFREPERLVWIANRTKDADNMSGRTLQVTPLVKLTERNQSFEDIAAFFAFFSPGGNRLTGTGEPERITGIPVSQKFFPLLGVHPLIGRHFTAEECKFGAPPVAILTHSFWQRRFASDPKILGRTMRIDDELVTITGVMPESFDFGAVFVPGIKVDFFAPFPMTEETNRWGNTVSVVGRLRPGVGLGRAQAEVDTLTPPINREQSGRGNLIDPQLTRLGEYVGGRMRPALLLLGAAVFTVMLIVCANLSNLMLARTSARQRELAIRTALGAGSGRLVRQLVTESLLLTGLGSVIAVAVAVALVQGISRLTVFNLPLLSTIRVDAGLLTFAVGLSMATGLLLGIAAALRAATLQNLSSSLRQRSSEGTGDGRNWASAGLVISEVAFAAVLLVGAGLLARSFLAVLDVELGFRPENAISLRLEHPIQDPPKATRESRAAARTAWLDDALDRVRKVPGVEAAAMADALPFGRNRTWGAGLKGVAYAPGQYPTSFVRLVSDGYLRSMGMRIKRGRDFTPQDVFGGAPVMLVNETLARVLAPDGEAIGKVMGNSCGQDRTIVGVVEDVRHLALETGAGNEMYLPMRQCLDSMARGEIVFRSSRPVTEVAAAVESALRPIAPDLPRGTAQPLGSLVDRAVSPRRFIVMMLMAFAVFALTLASLGIYGLISYSVTKRTQEIGIRMALGESAFAVQKRIVLRTMALALAGIAAGALVAAMLSSSIGSLLYGVSPMDPWAFCGAAAVLLAVAGLAGYLPARSASRIDPMICLRAD